MINSIQALRAIAATYVVIFHAARKLQIENGFTHAGASGVDLFFIISGFVITYTTLNRNVEWKEFLVRRVVRIVPLYWLLTLFFASVLLFAPSVFKTYEFDLIKLIQSMMFIPLSEKPVVYTGWTLNYEMYFYAIFTLGILLTGSRAPFLVGAVLLIPVIFGALVIKTTSPLIELVTSPLLVEFVMGILLCYLFGAGFRISPAQSLLLVLCGVISFFIFKDSARLISYGIPWLLVFVGIVFSSMKFAEFKCLLLLGDASYSIYLVHVFTLPALHFISNYFPVQTQHYPNFFLFLYSSLGVLSGVVCFILLERPITTYLKLTSNRLIQRTNPK